jgi:hypothetical protein
MDGNAFLCVKCPVISYCGGLPARFPKPQARGSSPFRDANKQQKIKRLRRHRKSRLKAPRFVSARCQRFGRAKGDRLTSNLLSLPRNLAARAGLSRSRHASYGCLKISTTKLRRDATARTMTDNIIQRAEDLVCFAVSSAAFAALAESAATLC